MYERTDGSSYKRPNEEADRTPDAADAIANRNKQVEGLLNDDPNALDAAPQPPPPPPQPTPTPEERP